MASTVQRRQRQATPARWAKAVDRAISENIQVRQLAGSGQWIATSGSDPNGAYELDVTGEVAHGCSCLAGLNGDPVCKHRAAFSLAVGLLDPEPEPPAAPASVACGSCDGRGWEIVTGKSGTDYGFACQVCEGAGTVPVGDCEDEPAPPLPGRPDRGRPAAPAACGRCGGSGAIVMPVAGGCGIYEVRHTCRACRGAGTVEQPAAVIAA